MSHTNTLRCLLICSTFALAAHTSAQCDAQIIHITGTQTIAGIDVTVEPFLDAGYAWDCGIDEGMGPYLCGGTLEGGGGYTFTFSPPAPQLMIDFSAIHTSASYEEYMQLFVNGAHYPIAAASTQVNVCNDQLAVLTPQGDVGAGGGGSYGWNGTIVPGPITTLTVRDSIPFGFPGGAFCSVFICDMGTGLNEAFPSFTVHPNPASELIRVNTSTDTESITLTDVRGRDIPLLMARASTVIDIDVSALPAGAYFLCIATTTGRSVEKLIIERSE